MATITALKMKALVLKEGGQASSPSTAPLEAFLGYETVDVPRPSRSEVLIKVILASVNPSDVIFIKGYQGRPRVKGRPAGGEGVGVVVETGDDPAARALKDKRVAFVTGSTFWGSWAEYAVAEAEFCSPLMPSVSDVDGAALLINPVTSLAMLDLVREAGAKSFVVAPGASQIGKFVISAAREEKIGATAIVRLHYQIPRFKEAGAAHVLNAHGPDYARALEDVVRTEKPLVLLDAVTGPLASNVFALMPEGSRWIVYGQLDTSTTTINEPSQLIMQDKKIEGFYLPIWMRKSPKRRVELELDAQKRFSDGRWSTDVTAIVPMREALDRVQNEIVKSDGKVFIAP